MGAFRDFFYWIFEDYVRDPLNRIRTTLDSGLVEPLTRSVNEMADLIREVMRAIVDVKDEIIGVVTSIEIIYSELIKLVDYLRVIKERFDDIDFGAGIKESLTEFVDDTITKIFTILKPNLIDELKTEIAISSIDEERFQDPEMKQAIVDLKEKWSHSPESGSDIANDLIDVVIGKVAKVQLEAVAGITLDASTPVTNSLFNQLAIVTDVTLATNLVSMIAEIVSIGQIDKIGQELRSYLDYSGFSQISGYGYGMILSGALATSITQELNSKMLNMPIDPATLVRLKYRESIAEDLYQTQMAYHGFGETQRKAYEDAYLYYPSPQDLVHWISKEVFEPDSVTKYGLLNEFDKLDLSAFRKAGLEEEQVKNFWVAHWDAPSFGQVTEMLFRGLITEADVYDWYRLVEIAPYWRDKLTKIQYHPYTRVDIRRMYTAGVVDREVVKRTYLDLGYDEEKAENLTVWTTAEKMATERDLTKTEILRLYTEGQLTADRAKDQVMALGYDSEESDLILMLADIKREDTEEKDLVATWTDLFKIHAIDLNTFINNVNSLDITEIKKNRLIAKAERAERSLIALPTKADLKSFLSKNIIDVDRFAVKMSALGYSDEDIEYYIKEAAT